MQNYINTRRRWWWVVCLVLLLALAACIAQIPVDPSVVDGETESVATAEVAEEPSAVESATDEAATGEAGTEDAPADDDSVASDSDGSATATVEGEEAASSAENATVEGAVESAATMLELAGGAPLPSTETYKGLPAGFTDEGFAYRGDPDAPLVMIEYSDYGCPFCNRHFVQTEPAVDESYVRTGQVRVVFHDFPLVSLHPNAPAAHEASLCVADQGLATTYWNYHAELFRSVEEWQTLDDPLPVFARLAEEGGVDTAAYEECMSSREMESVVQERVDAAFARGFNATPSFQVVRAEDDAVFELIGAQPYEQFAGVMDSALAGEMPAVAAEPEPQEQGIPFWASAEGWQPDPDRPGYNMAGDQYRGDVNAPVTVIEFSDFQCPFCQRHKVETQPALDTKYVETGKVLWVFKHFPLNIHPQAPAAGVAAECAAEQGLFWEMNQALFDSVEEWSVDEPTPVFEEVAAGVGVDGDAFAACMDDPQMMERVNSDMAEGEQFVQGTPTFIIVRGMQGSIIPGALPEATFSRELDKHLAEAGVTE
jgi:protein-disulfide isomerase